jgi:hypothetical protein
LVTSIPGDTDFILKDDDPDEAAAAIGRQQDKSSTPASPL